MKAIAFAMILFIGVNGLAQPGFEDYVYDPTLEAFPKITLPIAREDYLGIFDYMYQEDSHCVEERKTFDRNSCERPSRPNHPAVDFGVSPFDFKYDFLINPFPKGAKVKVTDIVDYSPLLPEPGLGYSVTLTCFLDGDYTNESNSNRYRIQFGHLKAGSFQVYEGQEDLEPGAILAQIGVSGDTTITRPHTHAEFWLTNAQYQFVTRVDPFKQSANDYNPTVEESLWFDQAWVDRITNYENSRTIMSRDNLKINGGFFVDFPNKELNAYEFTSQNGKEVVHLWVVAAPDDPDVDIGDLDLLSLPNVNPDPNLLLEGTIRFNFYNVAPIPGEFAFIAEYADGSYSTKVWVGVGNPQVKLGVFRPNGNQFFLDSDGNEAISVASGDETFAMGMAGDLPLVGDWDGDGKDETGLFRPNGNRFYLDVDGDRIFDQTQGDRLHAMGAPNDLPLVGDWNGDGKDEIGLFRPNGNRFYLDVNGNGVIDTFNGDVQYAMGSAGDLPLVGDWNGDGYDEIGVFHGQTNNFYLDKDGDGFIVTANGDLRFAMGATGDLPIVGDWNRDGKDEIGLFRPSDNRFYLDITGDGAIAIGGGDKWIVAGASGDLPLIGVW